MKNQVIIEEFAEPEPNQLYPGSASILRKIRCSDTKKQQ